MEKRHSFKSAWVVTPLFLLTVFTYAEALAQWGGSGGRQMGPGMMGGWGMGWFGGIFMIVFWVLVIMGLAFLIKWLIQTTKGASPEQGSSGALDILKERYVRGEIAKEEFEQMKKDIAR